MESSIKIGQEKKSLVSVFAFFLTAIGKVLEGRLGTRPGVPSKFEIFLIYYNSLRT